MFDRVHGFISSFRPPDPNSVRPLPDMVMTSAALSLAAGKTPAAAVENLWSLIDVPTDGRVLVIPSVASRPGHGAHPQAVASLLSHLGPRAVLGIPPATAAPLRGRWQRLAHERGAESVRLGSRGWDRVDLVDDAFLLDTVYLPAELHEFELRIAVPALRDESLALGFIRAIAHPHTRLRARGNIARVRLDAEVARSVQCSFLLDASRLPGLVATNLAAWADDPLSAELAAIGIQRYIDTARGFESVSAWEHERVQAAAELGIGPPNGDAMLLRIRASDRAVQELSEFLAKELSCKIERVAEGAIDAS